MEEKGIRVIEEGDGYVSLGSGGVDTRRAARSGDRDALAAVWSATRMFVIRMCRAELGPVLGTVRADSVAEGLLPAAVAAVLTGAGHSPLRAAYTEAVLGVESARPVTVARGPMYSLTRDERDVLVLRAAVGLTVAQSAEALACSADRVRRDQHSALLSLRGAAVGH